MTAPNTGTANGVKTPAGMTDAQFTALVTAKQGVQVFLNPAADPSVLAGIVNASDAWLAALGSYFVEQLMEQTDVGTPVGDRIRLYVEAHPVAETVTAEQEAAAQEAANAVPAKIVTVVPPVVATPQAPDAKSAPAVATVQHGKNFIEIVGDDIHDACVKALHWIESL